MPPSTASAPVRPASGRRWLAVAAAAALVGAAAIWALVGGPRGADVAPAAPPSVPAAAPEPAVADRVTAAPVANDPDAGRRELEVTHRTPTATPSSAQGLRGVVVDEGNRPLARASVYLVDSVANDPEPLPRLAQHPDAFRPVASTESAFDGTFAVGLPVAQDKLYELYVTSPGHATTRRGGLRVVAGQWHDLGAIGMVAGATLRGRVSVAGRDDIPVPGAVVDVAVGTVFDDVVLRALPDGGQGLTATTDANGRYELRRVPSRGMVQASCTAPGFARALRPNIEMRLDQPVELDFALLPGLAIAGDVHDERGNALANVRVEAWPQQAASPPTIAATDAHGHFELLGLTVGPYRLRTLARGFEPAEQRNVEAGRRDVHIVVQPLSRVRVQVVTPGGQTVRSYRLGLRRFFAEQDQIAPVPDLPEQRVRLDGTTDHAVIENVPRGVFCCQVEAEGFAKTLSEPIENLVEPGAPGGPRELTVVVTLTEGASLRGEVVGEDGQPLAGAVVTTQAAGTQPDSAFLRMVAGSLPDRITAARATTAADGSFAFAGLALADYQLMVEHPDACRTFVRDLKLRAPGEVRLPLIRAIGGALVRGRATVRGAVAGQVKVVLTTPAALPAGQEALRLETVTDARGEFELPRRVPPGSYELCAAAIGTSEPETQALRQLLQLKRSSVPVVVLAGQRRVERDIDLPE